MGIWEADAATVSELANKFIEMAVKYGVACCHHTCKNLDFNMKIIQASTLSPQMKELYAQILSQATLTDPLYTAPDAPDNGNGESETNPSSEEVLVNGTSESNGGQAGGQTAVGDQPASSQDASASASASAQSTSDSSQSSDSSEDASQASESDAYEVSKSSPAKSASADSSMPIVVIIAIIVLIAIFLVGYVRNKDDFDEY
jgi:cobaltochelatase CobN